MLSFDVYFIDWTPSHLRAWMADRAASKEEEVLKFKGFFFSLSLFLHGFNCVLLRIYILACIVRRIRRTQISGSVKFKMKAYKLLVLRF